MRCGRDGTECALSDVVPKLGGKCTKTRTVRGQVIPYEWAVTCPVCHGVNKLTLTARGRGLLRHCHKCEVVQDVLTAALVQLMPGCFWPARKVPVAAWKPPGPSDLQALALAAMPPMSLRLALLEMAGMSTPEALDKLGVRRENRSRVIAGRIRFDAKPQVA